MGKVFTIAEGLENMGALRTGGQGSVYKARRLAPIVTAVKILPTPIFSESDDDKNYRSFLNEVEKLKKVNEIPNPNVVKILNSGITESGSLPYIEMEFIEGPDLEELLQPPHEKIFTIQETVKLADQLASALSHCHSVGVKHGDIKSNNVKFNIHSGNYVLIDFGLSIMSDEQRRSSLRHAGAIEFMAPEQNEGIMMFQTDIYSYGVILYELLTGQVPFPLKDNGETNRNAVMIAHMEKEVPDILELRRQNLPKSWPIEKKDREMLIPVWLLQLISRCLQKLPDDRYANGTELHEVFVINNVPINVDDTIVKSITLLKAENADLTARLSQYQQQELNLKKSAVRLPKKIFAGLMLLLAATITFAGYSLMAKKGNAVAPATDSATKVTTVVPKVKPHSIKVNKTALTDTNLLKTKDFTGLDIPDNDSVTKAATAEQTPKKVHHKKKKKFLGIF